MWSWANHAEERKLRASGSTPFFPLCFGLHHHLDLQPVCTTSGWLSAQDKRSWGCFSGMLQTSGSSPWKRELISGPSCVGIPAGSHEAIWGLCRPPTAPAALSLPHPLLLSGIYSTTHPPPLTAPLPPPTPPHTHSEVTPSEILHLLLLLSLLPLSFSPSVMDELHTLGRLGLSITPCD